MTNNNVDSFVNTENTSESTLVISPEKPVIVEFELSDIRWDASIGRSITYRCTNNHLNHLEFVITPYNTQNFEEIWQHCIKMIKDDAN
jgi:hypothetical protein